MAKRVKVVLTESVATLGRDGDVVEVAPVMQGIFYYHLVKQLM